MTNEAIELMGQLKSLWTKVYGAGLFPLFVDGRFGEEPTSNKQIKAYLSQEEDLMWKLVTEFAYEWDFDWTDEENAQNVDDHLDKYLESEVAEISNYITEFKDGFSEMVEDEAERLLEYDDFRQNPDNGV